MIKEEGYYNEISRDDAYESFKKKVSLKDINIKRLEMILYNYELIDDIELKNSNGIKYLCVNMAYNFLIIFAIEDDYYIVDTSHCKLEYGFFKCDQWDGLINLLKFLFRNEVYK